MAVLETSLMVIAYTSIILTLFLEIICFKKNLEIIETIYFTISLLLLIVALTYTYFFENTNNPESTNAFLLITMILVGLTTPLNIFKERIHNIKPFIETIIKVVALLLLLLTIIGYFYNWLFYIQYAVVCFLGASVIFSMVLIKMSKPILKIAHREKIQKHIANVFLIFIPLSLGANYIADLNTINTKIGFTLPLVFIFLAVTKFWDDIQRLSLFRNEVNLNPSERLKNYALTKRELEVALHLIKGDTYKQISEELHVSVPTVKSHVYNIYKKCNVKNKIGLIGLVSS